MFCYERVFRKVFSAVLGLATVASIPFLVLGLWVLPFVLLEFSASDYWKLFVDPAYFSVGEQTPYAIPFGLYGIFVLWFLQFKGGPGRSVPRRTFVYGGLASGMFSAQHMIRYLWTEWSTVLGIAVIGFLACGVYQITVLLRARRVRNASG
jgi:hypothetical protein